MSDELTIVGAARRAGAGSSAGALRRSLAAAGLGRLARRRVRGADAAESRGHALLLQLGAST